MTDLETAIMIKNIARETVRRMSANVKNADETLFFKFPDHQAARAFLSSADIGFRDQYARLNRDDMSKAAILLKDKYKKEKPRIMNLVKTFQGVQINQQEYLRGKI